MWGQRSGAPGPQCRQQVWETDEEQPPSRNVVLIIILSTQTPADTGPGPMVLQRS